jgi:hypothetical protein
MEWGPEAEIHVDGAVAEGLAENLLAELQGQPEEE